MRLSFSSISTYRNCPWQYKLRYVDRLPTKRKPALSFGSSVHAAIRFFYDVPVPSPRPLEDVLSFLENNWESDGYSDQQENDSYLAHGRKVISDFYEANSVGFKLPIALEQKFHTDVNGCRLTGVIDKIDRHDNGDYEIIDFKTGRRLPPRSAVDNDLQLSIYHLAAEAVWGIIPDKLSLYYLIPKEKMTTKRTAEQVEETKTLISEVAEAISAKRFEPRENALCPWCDFHAHCPFRKHEAIIEGDDGVNGGKRPQFQDLVEEYIELSSEQKRIGDRLKELQPSLNNYCDEQNLARLYGKNSVIMRDPRAVDRYDEDKLREALRPFKLWEEISTLDGKRLNKLLSEKDIPQGVRNLIEDARRNGAARYVFGVRERRKMEMPTLF